MKSIKDKWNGTKITINYIGNLDDKFGVKKRRIILNEDKFEPFINYSIFNNIVSPRQIIKNNKTFYKNLNRENKVKNNENTIFNSLHIKDWEKANNFNFYNYFKNLKYFHRINNSKRILSTNIRQKLNKNNSSILFFGNGIEKKVNQKSNYFSAKRKNNKNFNRNNDFNNRKELTKNKDLKEIKDLSMIKNFYNKKLSKKNIKQIISNFKNKKITEAREFNNKNKIIDDKIRAKSLLLNLDIHNFNINVSSIKKIRNNNYNENYFNNIPNEKYYYSRDSKRNNNKNNDNINMKKTLIFNSNNPINSHIKIIVNQQNNNIINNINLINQKTGKKSNLCDASTNTDLVFINN